MPIHTLSQEVIANLQVFPHPEPYLDYEFHGMVTTWIREHVGDSMTLE